LSLQFFQNQSGEKNMYVILGATGNTGKRIAETLLTAGKSVTAVSRNADHLKSLVDKGATAAVGSLDDANFLTKIFTGATAVYALIPPNFGAPNYRAYQNNVGNAILDAVKNSGVKHIVFLSSVGAHLAQGSGVLLGLYDFETALAKHTDVNAIFLRAGYFMQNFFGSIGVVKHAGVLGGFPISGDIQIPMIHTNDIADVASHFLLKSDFTGQKKVDVVNAEKLNFHDAAKIIGEAISKPDLNYVQFPEEQMKGGMAQMGASESIINAYMEFSRMMNNDYNSYINALERTAEGTGKISLKEFAEKEFAPAFQHS
jgi:uncharacterized protein YbjT (DUF2867 family)